MTSVLSLTVATSGGLSKVNSFYMILDEALVAKKITPDVLGSFLDMSYGFGLKTLANTFDPVTDPDDIEWDTINYDPYSFADTGSTSVWRIKDDRWSHVQVGFSATMRPAEYGHGHIRANGTINQTPQDTIDYVSDVSGELGVLNMCTAPIPVSSGDWFSVYAGGNNAAIRIWPGSTNTCFWIIGFGKA